MAYQLSKKEIMSEILKSGKDPSYFINNYVRISHPIEGLIPFKTYPFQDDMLERFNDHRFNVILKARQLGLSTITAAYVVWFMLFHREKNILVMATKFQTATNLVKKVKSIVKGLPEWIRVADIHIDNRASFELSNGSQIKATSTSGDAGRSEALSLLVIDEAAHVEGLDELWTGLYPTLSTGGRCIALSTPNGVGNWFHKAYIDAEDEKNDFFPSILPWDVHPERDEEWYEKETRNMSARQIAQELECNFNTSGETVIHGDLLENMKNNLADPKYKTGFDRNYWIWEDYSPEFSYLLTADVARGDGKDSSAFHIIKLETMEVVAEYCGKPTLDQYANILFQCGKEYGECLMVVDNIGIGISVLEKLELLGYSNIYYSLKGSHDFIDPALAGMKRDSIPGFTTSTKTRPLIIAKLEEFVRNKLITIYSSRTHKELETFIWNGGKPEAMRGYNDDLVMALAVGCWVRDTALTVNKRDLEYRKAFFGAMTMKTTRFQHEQLGSSYSEKRTIEEKREDYFKNNSNFIWLMKG